MEASLTSSESCTLCGVPSRREVLSEALWLAPDVSARMLAEHPGAQREDGACPACVQETLLTTLLEHGEAALNESIQRVWPLDPEAAFGALPTPLRLRADPRYGGRGVTLALVDAAFYPHPDLVRPSNRIRAWADASADEVLVERYAPQDQPRWPGWDAQAEHQWHGLMTSVAAAGNGHVSRGFYRGLAKDAELVLVQVREASGRITNAGIARALRWLEAEGPGLGVRVVNLSLGGDLVSPLRGNPVDEAVAALVAQGVTVVVAAGNDGERRLVPPSTSPQALTIGGIDDRNTFDPAEMALWHSNYGETAHGALKPELVAPSLWVVAPVLPDTPLADEAAGLFARRARGDASVEPRLQETKLVTPHYQHVEGTSFAAPIVTSVVACMLEANPALTPRRIRELLMASACRVPGAPRERQGAGAVDAGRALARALGDQHSDAADFTHSPIVTPEGVRFLLHDHEAEEVRLLGSWDDWQRPGQLAKQIEVGLWEVSVESLAAGLHGYRFLVDDVIWLTDPANTDRISNGMGGWNSLVRRD